MVKRPSLEEKQRRLGLGWSYGQGEKWTSPLLCLWDVGCSDPPRAHASGSLLSGSTQKAVERYPLSLLKAGREGPSHSEMDQLCPSTELCVIWQGPSLVSQPCLGYFSPVSWDLRVPLSRWNTLLLNKGRFNPGEALGGCQWHLTWVWQNETPWFPTWQAWPEPCGGCLPTGPSGGRVGRKLPDKRRHWAFFHLGPCAFLSGWPIYTWFWFWTS